MMNDEIEKLCTELGVRRFSRTGETELICSKAAEAITQLRANLTAANARADEAWNEAVEETMKAQHEAWHRHAPPFNKRIEAQEAVVADMLNSVHALKRPTKSKPHEDDL